MQLPNSSSQLIFFFLSTQKWRFTLFCIFCIFGGFIPSIDGLLFKGLINAIEQLDKTSDCMHILWPWIIYYAVFWEIININWRIYDYLYLSCFPQIKADIIDKFYNYIQYQNREFFQEHMVGYIANRISEASRSLEMFLSIFTEKILMKLSIITTCLIAMYSIHSLLATILLTWLGVFCAISSLCAKTATNYSGNYAKNVASILGRIVDLISNINSIRMYSTYEYEKKRLGEQLDNTVNSEKKLQWFMFKIRYIQGTTCSVLIFSVLYTLSYLKSNNEITIGDFVMVITLCIAITENIWDLTQELGDLFQELGIFNQTLTLIKPYAIKDKENAQALKISEGTIQFQNVNFTYKKNSELFSNKNLIINGKQKVGLVGFSGSGKSTFVNLISRLFDVNSGKILIDGQNIKEVTLQSLRNEISLIPQEPILFNRTIMENIGYGFKDISKDKIYEAAKNAHIHDEIMKFPQGYDTICGEGGGGLSGGQRQRIIIARAILKNASILILDEATSALDNITEKLIKDSLKYLMKGRTVLIIAHRLSTLLDMDRILVFEKGKIVEDGTHQELLKSKKLYYELWQSQATPRFLID